MHRWLLVALIWLALPIAAAAEKRPTGKIWDHATFVKIRSYCIDSSALPGYEANDVERLVQNESKPKRLLSKLPWTLISDCSESDAIVKVSFRKLRKIDIQLGEPNSPDETYPYAYRADLQVSDEASARQLYEVEAAPLLNSMTGQTMTPEEEPDQTQRYDAAYHAFWTLIQDLQRVSENNPK
ncbi:MAG TPA: hypothetical protein VKM93_18430 [Terriglobia bacterium]|nr:hypothetical protein [Terriglobia bacterium]